MFLSFAKRDEVAAAALWDLLGEATCADRVYRFDLWAFDQAILVGEDWDACIRDALGDCAFGVLAVSNAFFGSAYITQIEAPAFLDVAGKRTIPVAVREAGRHVDKRGLDTKQIYGHDRPFDGLRGTAAKDVWVNELVDQVHRVLDRYGRPAGGQRP